MKNERVERHIDQMNTFGNMVKASIGVSVEACLDVGEEQGVPDHLMRSAVAAEGLLLAAKMVAHKNHPESFMRMARAAFEAATKKGT